METTHSLSSAEEGIPDLIPTYSVGIIYEMYNSTLADIVSETQASCDSMFGSPSLHNSSFRDPFTPSTTPTQSLSTPLSSMSIPDTVTPMSLSLVEKVYNCISLLHSHGGIHGFLSPLSFAVDPSSGLVLICDLWTILLGLVASVVRVGGWEERKRVEKKSLEDLETRSCVTEAVMSHSLEDDYDLPCPKSVSFTSVFPFIPTISLPYISPQSPLRLCESAWIDLDSYLSEKEEEKAGGEESDDEIRVRNVRKRSGSVSGNNEEQGKQLSVVICHEIYSILKAMQERKEKGEWKEGEKSEEVRFISAVSSFTCSDSLFFSPLSLLVPPSKLKGSSIESYINHLQTFDSFSLSLISLNLLSLSAPFLSFFRIFSVFAARDAINYAICEGNFPEFPLEDREADQDKQEKEKHSNQSLFFVYRSGLNPIPSMRMVPSEMTPIVKKCVHSLIQEVKARRVRGHFQPPGSVSKNTPVSVILSNHTSVVLPGNDIKDGPKQLPIFAHKLSILEQREKEILEARDRKSRDSIPREEKVIYGDVEDQTVGNTSLCSGSGHHLQAEFSVDPGKDDVNEYSIDTIDSDESDVSQNRRNTHDGVIPSIRKESSIVDPSKLQNVMEHKDIHETVERKAQFDSDGKRDEEYREDHVEQDRSVTPVASDRCGEDSFGSPSLLSMSHTLFPETHELPQHSQLITPQVGIPSTPIPKAPLTMSALGVNVNGTIVSDLEDADLSGSFPLRSYVLESPFASALEREKRSIREQERKKKEEEERSRLELLRKRQLDIIADYDTNIEKQRSERKLQELRKEEAKRREKERRRVAEQVRSQRIVEARRLEEEKKQLEIESLRKSRNEDPNPTLFSLSKLEHSYSGIPLSPISHILPSSPSTDISSNVHDLTGIIDLPPIPSPSLALPPAPSPSHSFSLSHVLHSGGASSSGVVVDHEELKDGDSKAGDGCVDAYGSYDQFYCHKHPDVSSSLYCDTCQACICELCCESTCKRHSRSSIAEAIHVCRDVERLEGRLAADDTEAPSTLLFVPSDSDGVIIQHIRQAYGQAIGLKYLLDKQKVKQEETEMSIVLLEKELGRCFTILEQKKEENEEMKRKVNNCSSVLAEIQTILVSQTDLPSCFSSSFALTIDQLEEGKRQADEELYFSCQNIQHIKTNIASIQQRVSYLKDIKTRWKDNYECICECVSSLKVLLTNSSMTKEKIIAVTQKDDKDENISLVTRVFKLTSSICPPSLLPFLSFIPHSSLIRSCLSQPTSRTSSGLVVSRPLIVGLLDDEKIIAVTQKDDKDENISLVTRVFKLTSSICPPSLLPFLSFIPHSSLIRSCLSQPTSRTSSGLVVSRPLIVGLLDDVPFVKKVVEGKSPQLFGNGDSDNQMDKSRMNAWGCIIPDIMCLVLFISGVGICLTNLFDSSDGVVKNHFVSWTIDDLLQPVYIKGMVYFVPSYRRAKKSSQGKESSESGHPIRVYSSSIADLLKSKRPTSHLALVSDDIAAIVPWAYCGIGKGVLFGGEEGKVVLFSPSSRSQNTMDEVTMRHGDAQRELGDVSVHRFTSMALSDDGFCLPVRPCLGGKSFVLTPKCTKWIGRKGGQVVVDTAELESSKKESSPLDDCLISLRTTKSKTPTLGGYIRVYEEGKMFVRGENEVEISIDGNNMFSDEEIRALISECETQEGKFKVITTRFSRLRQYLHSYVSPAPFREESTTIPQTKKAKKTYSDVGYFQKYGYDEDDSNDDDIVDSTPRSNDVFLKPLSQYREHIKPLLSSDISLSTASFQRIDPLNQIHLPPPSLLILLRLLCSLSRITSPSLCRKLYFHCYLDINCLMDMFNDSETIARLGFNFMARCIAMGGSSSRERRDIALDGDSSSSMSGSNSEGEKGKNPKKLSKRQRKRLKKKEKEEKERSREVEKQKNDDIVSDSACPTQPKDKTTIYTAQGDKIPDIWTLEGDLLYASECCVDEEVSHKPVCDQFTWITFQTIKGKISMWLKRYKSYKCLKQLLAIICALSECQFLCGEEEMMSLIIMPIVQFVADNSNGRCPYTWCLRFLHRLKGEEEKSDAVEESSVQEKEEKERSREVEKQKNDDIVSDSACPTQPKDKTTIYTAQGDKIPDIWTLEGDLLYASECCVDEEVSHKPVCDQFTWITFQTIKGKISMWLKRYKSYKCLKQLLAIICALSECQFLCGEEEMMSLIIMPIVQFVADNSNGRCPYTWCLRFLHRLKGEEEKSDAVEESSVHDEKEEDEPVKKRKYDTIVKKTLKNKIVPQFEVALEDGIPLNIEYCPHILSLTHTNTGKRIKFFSNFDIAGASDMFSYCGKLLCCILYNIMFFNPLMAIEVFRLIMMHIEGWFTVSIWTDNFENVMWLMRVIDICVNSVYHLSTTKDNLHKDCSHKKKYGNDRMDPLSCEELQKKFLVGIYGAVSPFYLHLIDPSFSFSIPLFIKESSESEEDKPTKVKDETTCSNSIFVDESGNLVVDYGSSVGDEGTS
ncbi:hypothetical protein ADUPG1_009265, partial [Aduncisulcus paluster]